MSWEASTYVLGQKVGSAARKLVLMGYANHAHADGTAAFPGIEKVADYAEVDKRTAQRHVAALVADGWMREGDQKLVSHYPANKRPIVYDLSMTPAQRAEWAALDAAGANTIRDRAKAAGEKGGRKSAEVRRGGNLSPQEIASSGEGATGDNLTPQEVIPRGDNLTPPGVTNGSSRGDTGVTQTTQETSLGNLPSSDSLRSSAAAGDDEPRSKARKRADAVELTEQETKTGRDADGNLLSGAKRDKLSVLIARGWWDWVDKTPGLSRPAQRFQACQQIIVTALANGHDPDLVKCGLAELSKQARPLTGATLTIAMQSEVCTPGGTAGNRGGRGGADVDWDAQREKARALEASMRGGVQ